MKTESELDDIAHEVCGLRFAQEWPEARKLLRSIQIDALREARDIMDSHARREEYAALSLPEIDKLIRELELR